MYHKISNSLLMECKNITNYIKMPFFVCNYGFFHMFSPNNHTIVTIWLTYFVTQMSSEDYMCRYKKGVRTLQGVRTLHLRHFSAIFIHLFGISAYNMLHWTMTLGTNSNMHLVISNFLTVEKYHRGYGRYKIWRRWSGHIPTLY